MGFWEKDFKDAVKTKPKEETVGKILAPTTAVEVLQLIDLVRKSFNTHLCTCGEKLILNTESIDGHWYCPVLLKFYESDDEGFLKYHKYIASEEILWFEIENLLDAYEYIYTDSNEARTVDWMNRQKLYASLEKAEELAANFKNKEEEERNIK